MDEVVEKIRARLAGIDPDGPRKVKGVFQMNINTADGVRNIIVDTNKLEVADGIAESPDVVLDADEDTVVQLSNKETTLTESEETGKATVSGNLELIAKLVEVLNNKF